MANQRSNGNALAYFLYAATGVGVMFLVINIHSWGQGFLALFVGVPLAIAFIRLVERTDKNVRR